MASSEKPTQSWSTHDIACTHCRERKIRCGRERPQCANCKRDGVECEYSTPGKRVNHIKLLCNNIGGLEDRLSNIEGKLSHMTNLLRTSGSQRSSIEMATEDEFPIDCPADDQLPEDTTSVPPTDRHIVRNQGDLIDRYHGPCSLFALCTSFCDTTLSEQRPQSLTPTKDEPLPSTQGTSAGNEAVKDVVTRMCLDAGIEEPFDLPSNHIPIRLPPKQFLLMVQPQCLQQADYATDIFVQSSFWSTVERIYSRPFTPADEAWAICFNTIILLFLGSEISAQGNDPLVGSQFARPFLMTVRTALSNPRVLMTPKLINVQALALLSIAAQIYYPPGFTESIFAQACVLARTMGLHQRHAVSDGVSPEEAQERFKVFRSLYLRDKSFSISRGSICWLPSFDCSLSSELGQVALTDSSCAARIQLAKLQEDIYRLFHSAESQRQSSAKHKSALARIEQDLERWTNEHDLFSSPCAGGRDADLQLEFLAARISAFRGSSEPSHTRRALNDARASCLLLLISSGKHDQSISQRTETIPISKNPSKTPARTASSRSNKRKSPSRDSPNTARESESESVPIPFHSLLDTFSVPAFFLLVKNVLWPASGSDESQTEEDINLLQKACACYKELDSRVQANNHTRKVGRAFERLLEVINLIKNPAQLQISPLTTRPSSKAHTPPSTQNLFGGPAGLSDFSDLPTSSAYPMPPMSWDAFGTNPVSTMTTEASSVAASPGLLTPMETDFFSQHFDQQSVSLSPSSRKRLRLAEPDVSLDDYSGSRLLSGFLASSPMMAFDVASQDDMSATVF